jgi:hypothetical protein
MAIEALLINGTMREKISTTLSLQKGSEQLFSLARILMN